MFYITCFGILMLLLIQFKIYKKNQNGHLIEFIKSEQSLEILKELLVIILGATVALNFTNIEDKNQTKKTVTKFLEVVYNDISIQYGHNESLVNKYNEKKMSAKQVKYNIQYNTTLFENILNNDTIITTVSPLIYSMLINDFRNLNNFHDAVEEQSDNEDYIITMILSMNSHNENIMWALETEIKHLEGSYTENELENLYNEYINSKYIAIPEAEIIKNEQLEP